MQLAVLERDQEVQELREKYDSVYQRTENVRKGTYAKLGQLNKMYDSLQYEFEALKASICREGNIR